MASAKHEPIMGVWGHSPQRGPGAEPLVRGSGGRPEAESFLLFARSGTPQIRVLFGIWTRTRAREMLLNVYTVRCRRNVYATVDIFAPGDTPCRFPAHFYWFQRRIWVILCKRYNL